MGAPIGVGRQRCAVDGTGEKAAEHGADGPETHSGRAPDLRREIADQGGGGDQDNPLHEADRDADQGIAQSCVDGGHGKDGEQGDDEEPVDDQVGAAEPVSEPGQQRGKSPDRIGDGKQADEVGEGHMQVAHHQRCHAATHIEGIVERDGNEHDEGELPAAACRIGIVIELAGHWAFPFLPDVTPRLAHHQARIRRCRDTP